MARPSVSVVMNFKYGIEYLNDALRSLAEQTYKDFELVFFDNNSQDSPQRLLSKYSSELQVKYVHSKLDLPLYEARNLAIKNATGEFISFLDADDTWYPEKLSAHLSFMISRQIDISGTNYNLRIENKISSFRARFDRLFMKQLLSTSDLCRRYNISMSTLMFHRDLYTQLGGFDSGLEIIGDFDFVIRASEITQIGWNPKILVQIRKHSSNTSYVKRSIHLLEFQNWISARGDLISTIKSPEVRHLSEELLLLEMAFSNSVSATPSISNFSTIFRRLRYLTLSLRSKSSL